MIRLRRRERHNAIGGTLLRDLAEAFDQAARDDAVRCVVTTGADGTFCPGADVADLAAVTEDDSPAYELLTNGGLGGDYGTPPYSPIQQRTERLGVGRWVRRMYELEKPTIAAINGAAIGGGLGIALLHDFRIAGVSAKFALPQVRFGVGPEMGLSYLLPRLVGWRVARDLMLRGRMMTGVEAADAGLVDDAVPDEAVFGQAWTLAQELAALPPSGVQMTKRLLRASTTSGLEAHLEAEWHSHLRLFDLPECKTALGDYLSGIRAETTDA